MRCEPVVGLNGGGREGRRKCNIERTRRRKANNISVEEYNCFSQIRDPAHLTIHHLNQIIEMHGFMKIHKAQKKVLMDVVDSLDLMDPSRSTLGDDVTSSCAFITSEEAIMDLAALKWQDCCFTSLQTLNLTTTNNSSLELHNIKVECVSNPVPIPKRKRSRKLKASSSSLNLHNIKVEGVSTPIPKRKRSRKLKASSSSLNLHDIKVEGVSTPIPKRKRSRKRMLRLASLNGYNNSCPPTTTITGNDFGSPSVNVGTWAGGARKLVPRRKRIVRSNDEFGSTVW